MKVFNQSVSKVKCQIHADSEITSLFEFCFSENVGLFFSTILVSFDFFKNETTGCLIGEAPLDTAGLEFVEVPNIFILSFTGIEPVFSDSVGTNFGFLFFDGGEGGFFCGLMEVFLLTNGCDGSFEKVSEVSDDFSELFLLIFLKRFSNSDLSPFR